MVQRTQPIDQHRAQPIAPARALDTVEAPALQLAVEADQVEHHDAANPLSDKLADLDRPEPEPERSRQASGLTRARGMRTALGAPEDDRDTIARDIAHEANAFKKAVEAAVAAGQSPAALFDSARWIALYDRAESAGLFDQARAIDAVIKEQKTQAVNGRTGIALALREEAVTAAQHAQVALFEENDTQLEARGRSLVAEYAKVMRAIKELESAKRDAEETRSASTDRFRVKEARLSLSGGVADREGRAITIDRQLAMLRGALQALEGSKVMIDHRRTDLRDALAGVGRAIGVEISAASTTDAIIAALNQIESRFPIGVTNAIGPDWKYGDLRKLVAAYVQTAEQRQAAAYGAVRVSLVKAGLDTRELEHLGFPAASDRTVIEKKLVALVTFAERLNGGTHDPRDARQLADYARSIGKTHLSRTDLLDIVRGVSGAQFDRGAIALASALVTHTELSRSIGMTRNGAIGAQTLIEYADAEERLASYWTGAKKAGAKQENTTPSASDAKLARPTYFAGAQSIVDQLDPQSERWLLPGDPFFHALKDLDLGQRAYLMGLFQATYSKKYGAEFLERFMRNAPAGTAGAYLSMLQGRTVAEHRATFEDEVLSKTGGVEEFLRRHRIGLEHVQHAAERIRMPVALMRDYQQRIDRYAMLLATGAGAKSNELATTAGEIEFLASALIAARNASQASHDAAVVALGDFMHKLAIATASSVAAGMTAGALAPEAGVALAGLAGALAGTAAGMTVAFSWDVGAQLADKGARAVRVSHAFSAAVDAAPDAFAAALPTSFITAGMATAGKKLLDGLTAARAGGTVTKWTELGVKARVTAGVAMYSGASSYVGSFAVAAYYNARGDARAAEAVLAHPARDAMFAAAGASLLMPLGSLDPKWRPTVNAGAFAAQRIANNIVSDRAWDDGVIEAGATGFVTGIGGKRRADRPTSAPRTRGFRDVDVAEFTEPPTSPNVQREHNAIGFKGVVEWTEIDSVLRREIENGNHELHVLTHAHGKVEADGAGWKISDQQQATEFMSEDAVTARAIMREFRGVKVRLYDALDPVQYDAFMRQQARAAEGASGVASVAAICYSAQFLLPNAPAR